MIITVQHQSGEAVALSTDPAPGIGLCFIKQSAAALLGRPHTIQPPVLVSPHRLACMQHSQTGMGGADQTAPAPGTGPSIIDHSHVPHVTLTAGVGDAVAVHPGVLTGDKAFRHRRNAQTQERSWRWGRRHLQPFAAEWHLRHWQVSPSISVSCHGASVTPLARTRARNGCPATEALTKPCLKTGWMPPVRQGTDGCVARLAVMFPTQLSLYPSTGARARADAGRRPKCPAAAEPTGKMIECAARPGAGLTNFAVVVDDDHYRPLGIDLQIW